MINSYKDLTVWQKSIDLVESIYKITKSFPKSETYGLSLQMRQSVVSIPSNIAEGNRRSTRKDDAKYLSIAFGSGAELVTQLIIAKKLSYINNSNDYSANELLERVMKMLNRLIKSLH